MLCRYLCRSDLNVGRRTIYLITRPHINENFEVVIFRRSSFLKNSTPTWEQTQHIDYGNQRQCYCGTSWLQHVRLTQVQIDRASRIKGTRVVRLPPWGTWELLSSGMLLLLLLLLLALQPTMGFSLLSDLPPFHHFHTQLSPPFYS
jgi:hypothetical protein